jgi:hypothetical protein
VRFGVLCGYARSSPCPCEGRPLEVPNPAATQVHPHRDVWLSTTRPSGHPWVHLSASLGQPTMHFWVFGSRLVYVHPRTRILQAQQASSNRSDLNEPKAVYVLAHHAYRRCPWNVDPHLFWVFGFPYPPRPHHHPPPPASAPTTLLCVAARGLHFTPQPPAYTRMFSLRMGLALPSCMRVGAVTPHVSRKPPPAREGLMELQCSARRAAPRELRSNKTFQHSNAPFDLPPIA